MGNNGNGDYCNLFGKEQVKYPVQFDLKVIMDNQLPEEENRQKVTQVLEKNHIPFSSWRSKLSSNNTYISLTVNIRIENRTILKSLYDDLKSIPEVKYAV